MKRWLITIGIFLCGVVSAMAGNDIHLIDSLAIAHLTRCEYKDAEAYLLQEEYILKDSLGTKDPRYAKVVSNLGRLYSETGDFIQAEPYLLQAIQIYKEAGDEHSPDYATVLSNMGAFYYYMGNYVQASYYSLQAHYIWVENYGESSEEGAISYSNLALYCSEMGEYELAERFFGVAVQLQDSIYNGSSLAYASTLSNIGMHFERKGDYGTACVYYYDALKMREKLLGTDNPDYALTLNNIGVVFLRMGDYDQAETCFKAAYRIQQKTLYFLNQNRITSMQNLGALYYEMGCYEEAKQYIVDSYFYQKYLFVNSVDVMSEYQRQEYWRTMQYTYETLVPNFVYMYSFEDNSIADFAYNNELFKKGLLLTSANAIRYSILGSGDTTLIRQWNELNSQKQRIMALEKVEDDNPSYVEQLRVEAEALEKAITNRSAAYRESQHVWSITWDSVRNVLQPKQVAIEFMAAPLSADTTVYCALLVRHNSKQPELIPLFNLRDIQPILAHKDPNRIYLPREHGLALKNAIWGKVLPRLKAGETVYFAPTGVLHQIAIEHLPFDENHTMNEIYNLRRLSSTRELVLHHSLDSPLSTATLYGGIHYSLSDTTMAKNAAKSTTKTRGTATRELEVKGRKILVADTLEDLPGTKIEVEHIRMLLDSMHIRAQVYMADTASEESFRALSGQHRNILHLATHGFFNEDTENTIDPMERSGLIFAGANKAWSGHREEIPDGVQDGILLAKEISDLDLRDANLVVLSACQTGLGDITGEGVFGLQRAFKMAGVQTIVMSLWPVNDQATQILMTALYRNLAAGQSKHEAFRNAQSAVRDYVPGPDEPPTLNFRLPRFWAGFILLD